MSALVKAQRIAQDGSERAECFRQLLTALKRGDEFPLSRLYQISYADFELALKLLGEWRVQRYVACAEPDERPRVEAREPA